MWSDIELFGLVEAFCISNPMSIVKITMPYLLTITTFWTSAITCIIILYRFLNHELYNPEQLQNNGDDMDIK